MGRLIAPAAGILHPVPVIDDCPVVLISRVIPHVHEIPVFVIFEKFHRRGHAWTHIAVGAQEEIPP